MELDVIFCLILKVSQWLHVSEPQGSSLDMGHCGTVGAKSHCIPLDKNADTDVMHFVCLLQNNTLAEHFYICTFFLVVV